MEGLRIGERLVLVQPRDLNAKVFLASSEEDYASKFVTNQMLMNFSNCMKVSCFLHYLLCVQFVSLELIMIAPLNEGFNLFKRTRSIMSLWL